MTATVEQIVGGVRWCWDTTHTGMDVLLGTAGLRLDEWVASGVAHVVKHGVHRTVYHVRLPGLDVHVKHNRLADTRARLRESLRPSKARSEFDKARAVAARNIPTIIPLAYGELIGADRSSFLITQTLPATQPLHTFLEQTLPGLPARRGAPLRQRIATALGELLARMHDAGVAQHDLHPGNFLLHLDDDRPSLYLIDLHPVRLGRPLAGRAVRDNLAVLNRWFVLRATRADRRRFWRAYAAARRVVRPSLPGDDARAIRDLEAATTRSNLRFWRGYDARCVGRNRYFRKIRHGSLLGHAVADLDPAALAPLLADPDAPFRGDAAGLASGIVVLKDSPSSRVVEFDLPTADGPRRVVFKRFAVTRTTDPLVSLVRPTPALRSYVHGHVLLHRKLPTPRPLAVWHRRRLGMCREGYLLTDKVHDAIDLGRFVARLVEKPAAERRTILRPLLDRVARLVNRLHARNLSHRDLKAGNVLLSLFEDKIADVWLIDLVGVRRHREVGRLRRIQNLTRLNASFHGRPGLTRADRLRFLRVYLAWGLHGRRGWKAWWREVEEATRVKVARTLRKGRPLG